MARLIVAGVQGVREIQSNVQLRRVAERPDQELAREVRARLESSVWIDGQEIESRVERGKVWLTGRLATQQQRHVAAV